MKKQIVEHQKQKESTTMTQTRKEIAEELKSSDDDQCSAECLEKLIYHKAVI